MPAAGNTDHPAQAPDGSTFRPSSTATDNFELSTARPMQVEYVSGYLPDSKDWLRRQEEAREQEAIREQEVRLESRPSPAYRESAGGRGHGGDVERERKRHRKKSRRPRET